MATASPTPAPPEAPCTACPRAEELLASLGPDGELLRAAVPRLMGLGQLGIDGERLTSHQRAALDGVQLTDEERAALARLGPAERKTLAQYACGVDSSPCVDHVLGALQCMTSGACYIIPERVDLRDPTDPGTCDPYVVDLPSSRTAFGGELSTGGQSSTYPVEGRVWGFGFEGRRRFSRRLGIVGRFDWTRGRDAGRDRDATGHDDVATGPITREWLLGGPSITLTAAHYDRVVRWWQLDLLGGYVWTSSQTGDDGVAAGADLSYELGPGRLGVRALQGVGGASEVRTLLVHLGIVGGGAPSFQYGAGCGRSREEDHTTAWALGFDVPLGGYNLGGGPGYIAPGFGLEGAYRLHLRAALIVRGDLLVFPNGDDDRVLHQSVLAGGRFDLMPLSTQTLRKGAFFTLLAGYAFSAYTRPSDAGSGPVIDLGVGAGTQADDGFAWLRLHGRFGLSPAIQDLRAVFLSIGLEWRVDRRRWRDTEND